MASCRVYSTNSEGPSCKALGHIMPNAIAVLQVFLCQSRFPIVFARVGHTGHSFFDNRCDGGASDFYLAGDCSSRRRNGHFAVGLCSVI